MFNTAEIDKQKLVKKVFESDIYFLFLVMLVAILIIVMSVMNGFRTNLTENSGLNPHLTLETENFQIKEDFKRFKNDS